MFFCTMYSYEAHLFNAMRDINFRGPGSSWNISIGLFISHITQRILYLFILSPVLSIAPAMSLSHSHPPCCIWRCHCRLLTIIPKKWYFTNMSIDSHLIPTRNSCAYVLMLILANLTNNGLRTVGSLEPPLVLWLTLGRADVRWSCPGQFQV